MKSVVYKILITPFPSVILALIIGYFSLFPYEELGILWATSDIIKHFFAYFVLGTLLYFPMVKYNPTTPLIKVAALVVAFCFMYGGLMELGQQFSPGRHPSMTDALVNIIGAIFSQIAVILAGKKSV